MNRFEYNVGALKAPAIVLLVTTLASAAVVWFSESYLSAHELRLQQARNELNRARDEYRQAVEAKTFVNTVQQRYLQLEQRGFVGNEPRLSWIEALRNSGHKQHLYALQYNLKQRQSLQLTDSDGNGHYQVYGSFMQLDMELAHEVELLRYFDDLERERPGVWSLRGCTLSSVAADNNIALDKPNIRASCELAWYTLMPHSGNSEGEDTL